MNTNAAPKVCVLILNWNGAELLERYIPHLIGNTPTEIAEIILADNGSTDDSLAVLERLGIKTITLDTNYGFAEGYNRAIQMIDHEYVCLLNSDVRVGDHWLEPLLDFITAHDDVVSVQPKLRWDRQTQFFEYSGAQGGYLDRWGYPFCRGRIFDTLEEDQGQYGYEPEQVFWTTGACMLVRRDRYIEAGGLAASFFAHQEEIDLCWRWQNRGYRLFVIPQSIVYHYGGASLSAENPHKTYLNFRNNLLMLYRNLPSHQQGKVFFVRFFLDLLAAFVFLLKGKSGDSCAVFRAWRDFAQMKKRTDQSDKNKEIGYTRLYPHTLLWRYHVYGERTYAKLKK